MRDLSTAIIGNAVHCNGEQETITLEVLLNFLPRFGEAMDVLTLQFVKGNSRRMLL